MAEPCTAVVTPGIDGGLSIALTVPTSGGEARFTLTAERGGDGDWVVGIPWPDSVADTWNEDTSLFANLPSGHEVAGGVVYLGAPEEA